MTLKPPSSYPGAARCISLRQLAEGAASAPLLDDGGHLTDPLVLVDLDVPTDPVLRADAACAALAGDRILLGIARRGCPDDRWHDLLDALDLTITVASPLPTPRWCVDVPAPEAAAKRLQAAAAATPQAALVLSRLLRDADGLPVRAALNAESLAYSTLLSGLEFRRWLSSRKRRPVPLPDKEPAVLVERDAETLKVTLNRAARRNAYSCELRDALVDALLAPAFDDTITQVVIAGNGPSFCSGGDLDEFGTTPDAATGHFIRTTAGVARLLHKIGDRTEIRLHGACVGAGAELAAFAGTIVARPGTTFRLPELAMGLIPGAGGTVSIPRRIGRWRTLYMALSGLPLDVVTAISWGLVDKTSAIANAEPFTNAAAGVLWA